MKLLNLIKKVIKFALKSPGRVPSKIFGVLRSMTLFRMRQGQLIVFEFQLSNRKVKVSKNLLKLAQANATQTKKALICLSQSDTATEKEQQKKAAEALERTGYRVFYSYEAYAADAPKWNLLRIGNKYELGPEFEQFLVIVSSNPQSAVPFYLASANDKSELIVTLSHSGKSLPANFHPMIDHLISAEEVQVGAINHLQFQKPEELSLRLKDVLVTTQNTANNEFTPSFLRNSSVQFPGAPTRSDTECVLLLQAPPEGGPTFDDMLKQLSPKVEGIWLRNCHSFRYENLIKKQDVHQLLSEILRAGVRHECVYS